MGNGRTKFGCDRYMRWLGHLSWEMDAPNLGVTDMCVGWGIYQKKFFYKCNKIKYLQYKNFMQGVPCIGHFHLFTWRHISMVEPNLNHLVFYILVLLCFYRGKGFELFTQRVSNP